jgi:hypothetical protein
MSANGKDRHVQPAGRNTEPSEATVDGAQIVLTIRSIRDPVLEPIVTASDPHLIIRPEGRWHRPGHS